MYVGILGRKLSGREPISEFINCFLCCHLTIYGANIPPGKPATNTNLFNLNELLNQTLLLQKTSSTISLQKLIKFINIVRVSGRHSSISHLKFAAVNLVNNSVREFCSVVHK